jgi:saccharopine dehydrogenase-like NADP-dependent oxidoreductase
VSIVEAFALTCEQKMTLEQQDRDLIAMVHYFLVEYPNTSNHAQEVVKSSMVIVGNNNGGLSGMSMTVGFPVAIAAKLVGEKVITRTGVFRPIYSDVYEPIIAKLKELNLFCKEESIQLSEMPRL